MIIYKDSFSGDELFSDAYPSKVIDDFLIEVDCQLVTIRKGTDVDIGANPSAEEAEEQYEEDSEQVNNVIYSFRLMEMTGYSKNDYSGYFRQYAKQLADHLKETNSDLNLKEWKNKMINHFKRVTDNTTFDEYQFYTGESGLVIEGGDKPVTEQVDDGGEKKKAESKYAMLALLNYREDGITPYFTFIKHGLKEEKV